MARKGLPKSIIKKYGISKKAWRIFRGRKKRPRSRVSNPKTKRRTRRMGRKKRRGGGKSLQATVFKWLRIGALVAPAVNDVLRGQTPQQKAVYVIESYSGYNIDKGQFNFAWLARGWLPFVATSLMTYGIPKLMGIIRRI